MLYWNLIYAHKGSDTAWIKRELGKEEIVFTEIHGKRNTNLKNGQKIKSKMPFKNQKVFSSNCNDLILTLKMDSFPHN